jgi:hypothetical protein
MEISPLKSKVMIVEGHIPIRSESITDNTILEQVNMATCLESKISYG